MRFFKSLFSNRFVIKGYKNKLNISKTAYLRKSKIKIYGNNNLVEIDENCYLHNVYLRIGFLDTPINDCVVKIGNGTSFNSCDMQLGESSSSLLIGEGCMFSFDVEIACTDTHAITDFDDNLINVGREIQIGSNVWVCKEVKILKNTKIPDNCIVAQNSIVTKNFDKENCVIAGNPAKIVKENIKWHRPRTEKLRGN